MSTQVCGPALLIHFYGFSDVRKFANIIKTNNPDIQVELLDWYKDEPKKKEE